MGILDSLKKATADTLKSVAEEAIKSATGAVTASDKAAKLVGSKAETTTPVAPTVAGSAAAAKAATLVGSKAPASEQQYAATASANELPPAVLETIIDARAREKNMFSNWRSSITDLLAVLGMDNSLNARRALGVKLNYSGRDADGSVEKDSWLHVALLKVLALNGGEVPAYLKEAAPAASYSTYTTPASTPAAPFTQVRGGLSYAEVERIIDNKVRARGGVSNWRYSIVDLLSTLGMNSSLTARSALAAKLNYSGRDADGSAEKNMWLHAEILRIFAENGGNIPSYLDSGSGGSNFNTQPYTPPPPPRPRPPTPTPQPQPQPSPSDASDSAASAARAAAEKALRRARGESN
jgi:hypothetical protein